MLRSQDGQKRAIISLNAEFNSKPVTVMKERYPCKIYMKDELLIVGTPNAITFGPFLSLPHGHGRLRRFPTRHSIMVLTEFSSGDVLSQVFADVKPLGIFYSGISWDIYKTVSANERLAESFVEGVRFQRKVADCGAQSSLILTRIYVLDCFHSHLSSARP